MVNDKMVNGFMEKKNVINRALAAKKLYIAPLMEVSQINLSSCILDGSPVAEPLPIPPLGPGAPKRRTPVF